jgi:surface polysaccharide O-acyltransferase-like enzyme
MYAMWEQLTGIAIMVALIGIGKQYLNRQSVLWSKLSRSSFTVYIFHPLVVITFSLLLANWDIEPAIKLLIVSPLAVMGSFLLASVILVIPGVKRII